TQRGRCLGARTQVDGGMILCEPLQQRSPVRQLLFEASRIDVRTARDVGEERLPQRLRVAEDREVERDRRHRRTAFTTRTNGFPSNHSTTLIPPYDWSSRNIASAGMRSASARIARITTACVKTAAVAPA